MIQAASRNRARYVRSRKTGKAEAHVSAQKPAILPENIARRLSAEVDRQGIPRAELARRMKVTRAYVSKVLRGTTNLSLETLDVFAKALGCNWLFMLSTTPTIYGTQPHESTPPRAAENGVQYGEQPHARGLPAQLPLFAGPAFPRAIQPTAGLRPRTRPFLKWAGGKSSLLPELLKRMPSSFDRYFEPFIGGGALFFDLAPRLAILSDANPDLIQCYKMVRDHLPDLISALKPLKVTEQEFYRLRALSPATLDPIVRAARFIYLNKTCFNGLYRVNKRGQFNTPFGKRTNVRVCDDGALVLASEALRGVELLAGDYIQVLLDTATRGDFVYLDPPYLPVSIYSDFKRYTPDQFRGLDHERLAETCRSLDKRGCKFLLSNSYHPRVTELYAGFTIHTVEAPRLINCRASGRGNVKELIVMNYSVEAS